MSTYRQDRERHTLNVVVATSLVGSLLINLALGAVSITQETRRDAVFTCVDHANEAALAGDDEAAQRWIVEARRADRLLVCKDGGR